MEPIVNIPFVDFIIFQILFFFLYKRSQHHEDYLKRTNQLDLKSRSNEIISALYLGGKISIGIFALLYLIRDINLYIF